MLTTLYGLDIDQPTIYTYAYETLAQLVKSHLEAARLRVRRELRAGVQAFLEREGGEREEES